MWLAGEDKLLTKAHKHGSNGRQSLQTTLEGIVSCAKTEEVITKKNGNGWALAVKDAGAWGRAALMESSPCPARGGDGAREKEGAAAEQGRHRRREAGSCQEEEGGHGGCPCSARGAEGPSLGAVDWIRARVFMHIGTESVRGCAHAPGRERPPISTSGVAVGPREADAAALGVEEAVVVLHEVRP